MIGSAALMLRHSFGLDDEATEIESAIRKVISAGIRTADIAGADDSPVSTTEMADAIIQQLR
jgi:3-isopropylmalate dehydrogenase